MKLYRKSHFYCLAFILLIFISCTKDKSVPVSEPLPHFIIDTDMGIDDAMALLYFLNFDDISIDGITICGTGMSNLKPATANALGLIALAEQPNIPVAFGDSTAINSQNTALRPPEWMAEANTMMGLTLPQNPNLPQPKGASEFIVEKLSEAENPIRFLVLGPLTNLGRALMAEPHLASKIETVYVMGGAVNVPGNLESGGIDDNDFAEWNIFLDPHAADIVFRSGVDVVLVSLDVTNKAPVTAEFYQRFSNDHSTPQANFVFGIISNLEGYYDTFYFWDPLAAVIATNRSLAAAQSYQLQVVLNVGSENGRTKVITAGGDPIEVCEDVDLAVFESLFLDVLNDRD